MKREKKKTGVKKEKKYVYPHWQYVFNICSMIFGLLIFVVIGGRCFYYFSKLNLKIAVEAKTISTIVQKNNAVVTEGEGLYKGKEGYYFKGQNVSNYVSYSNRLWRIVSIDQDGQTTLVSDANQTTLFWGEETHFEKSDPYYYLTKLETPNSGIFLDTLSETDHYLSETSWCEETLKEDKVNCGKQQRSKARLLTLTEYQRAGAEASYLNRGSYSWLMGIDKTGKKLALDKTGAIVSSETSEGFGIRPVITLKSKIEISSGNGTAADPYRIDLEHDSSVYNRFVALGGDLFRIVGMDQNHYRLALNTYLPNVERIYSDDTLDYDVTDRRGLAYYLNRTYYDKLAYASLLQDCEFATGELTTENGTSYLNQYQNLVTAKVGLLTMTDLNLNEHLTDYFSLNRTMNAGELLLVGNQEGKILEEVMSEKKQVVPVVCINRNAIVSGDGLVDTPYRTE